MFLSCRNISKAASPAACPHRKQKPEVSPFHGCLDSLTRRYTCIPQVGYSVGCSQSIGHTNAPGR